MTSRFPVGNFGTGGNKENGSAKDNGNGKDGVFDLDSAAFASDQFRMNEFKVRRSSFRTGTTPFLGQEMSQSAASRLDTMSVRSSWGEGEEERS